MKKYLNQVFVFLTLLLLLSLPQSVYAENTIEYSTHLYCSPGQERAAVYPDFSEKIGSGLTQDDFIITYESTSEYLTVDETGLCSVSADAPMNTNLRLKIIYTPRDAGVGEKTTFVIVLRTIEQMTSFEASRDVIYTNVSGGQTQLVIDGVTDYEKQIVQITYDPEIVALDTYTYYDKILNYYVRPVGKAGETEIRFTSYNNMTTSTKVIVVDRPSKLEFAADRFVCHVGETIDLGTDMGNGEYGLLGYPPTVNLYSGNELISREGFISGNGRYFHAQKTGFYRIDVTSGSISGSVLVEVYDKANCDFIDLSSGHLYKDRAGIKVRCYDENGSLVLLPMSITAGSDIASLEGDVISATGLGSVTVTVQNEDGSTTSQTFEVMENPTTMTLNASDITLPIESAYELKVSFDQGAYPYEYTITYDDNDPNYGLYCIRMTGDRIIAQAPGSATITVKAGPLSAACRVTVPESEKELSIETPPHPFGIGHTFKLEVRDQTGKVYPAVFRTDDGSPQGVLVEKDGTITGNAERTGWVIATLEDGRVLKVGIDVKKVPNWLKYTNIAARLSDGTVYLNWFESDVGDIYTRELEVTVADPSIVSYPGPGSSYLRLLQPGVTEVTFKSIYCDTSVTILVEVIGDNTLYAGSTTLEVPYGYMTYLPPVTDGYGNVVDITWKITYDMAGEGNPESSGFVLEEDTIACVWPTARCVVTGTSKDGATVKVFVNGYLLPTEIYTVPDGVKLRVGDSKNIRVLSDQAGTEINLVYWVVENEGIISFAEVTESDTNRVNAVAEGSTRLLAMLDNGAYAICEIIVGTGSNSVPGDANSDGVVDQEDALLVMQYDAGWDVDVNIYAADVNADGHVDSNDALLILQHAAGLDVVLRKAEPAS